MVQIWDFAAEFEWEEGEVLIFDDSFRHDVCVMFFILSF